MPAYGACLLGSLNLSAFVKDQKFDYNDFKTAISIAVKALNNVLDEGIPKHPLKEQQECAKNWRQIGLGIFGLGDCLIKLGIKYGSKESLDFINQMGKVFINVALQSSATLAKEYGPYPKYDDKVLQSKFLLNVATPETIDYIKSCGGLRNSQLMTCAPTGSLSSLINCSGSAEPLFATSYTRRTVSLNNTDTYYKVYPQIIKQFIDQGYTEETLPDYIVTSEKINYIDRVNVQGTLQKYIDASISSTVNLPESTTIQDVFDLYMHAWMAGCKGITVWRNNCNRQAILTTETPKEEKKPQFNFDSITPISRKQLGTTSGSTFCKKCACGTLYITANKDSNGNLVEVFTHTSKGGICQANMNAVTRMISLGLRSGVKIAEINDQLRGINCPACSVNKAKGVKIDGLSCPDIISKTITEFISGKQKPVKATPVAVSIPEVKTSTDKCPECGEPIIRDGGCVQCLNCGWTKCQ